jgi:alpha-methylacyl-CoA racemase
MIDGASSLMAAIYGLRAAGRWTDQRGDNILDTGAHYYNVYETSDGKYVSVGSIEPKFYAELLRLSGLQQEELPRQNDKVSWPQLTDRLAAIFRTKTRDEWCRLMEGSEVCFAPILNMEEAPNHPHNRERGTFVEMDGVVQPAPAPRFSRTPSEIQRPPARPGEHTEEALHAWGFSPADVDRLRGAGAVGAR